MTEAIQKVTWGGGANPNEILGRGSGQGNGAWGAPPRRWPAPAPAGCPASCPRGPAAPGCGPGRPPRGPRGGRRALRPCHKRRGRSRKRQKQTSWVEKPEADRVAIAGEPFKAPKQAYNLEGGEGKFAGTINFLPGKPTSGTTLDRRNT